jgi:nitroimidazol reductase NimA-like FMN-containing flavoprotein (pyridoxamine 5'-phosphate oxidase superfamily)
MSSPSPPPQSPPPFVPTARTRLRRHAERGSYDRDLVHAILDEALVCHVGFVHDEQPFVIPTAFARVHELVYLHGAVANRMLGALAGGARACLTVTLLDGLVLARSYMHHSMNYRSVCVLGQAREVTDPEEKRTAFAALIERVQPGRSQAARPASDDELRATRVLALPLVEVSAKVRTGPPVDDAADLGLPHWAGVIPLKLTAEEPIPDAPPANDP